MYGTSQNSFADLMSMAKQNADAAKKKANTGLYGDANRPKKADPKQVKLKEGVAKFLAKQQEEEKKKKEEEKLKKEKLLQLRQQDRKAQNRVRKMLSMTKSANKSCVEDARDCLNESVAAQGEEQPDEDDYGYTSNYANLMHKKMMEKYKAIPVKPAFPQTSSVPVPRPQSLKNGTGWRKNDSSHDYEDERGYSSPEQERREETPSRKPSKPPKPNRPPPPDYRLLLQIAQEKQAEPALPLKPIVDKSMEREEFEFGRPMTAKEKKAFLEMKEMKERLARRMEGKQDRNNNSSGSGGGSTSDKNGKMPSFKIPKARSNTEEDKAASSAPPAKKPKVSEFEPSSNKPIREVPKIAKQSESSSSSSSKPTPVSNGKINGIKPSVNGASRPVEKPQKQSSSSSPVYTSKSKSDSQRDKPSQPKPDPRSEKIMQERLQLIKEKPRYLSAFEGKEKERERERERDRDNYKKQPLISNDSNKPRPGGSRDIPSGLKEKQYDSRDKMRMGSKMSPPDDRNRQLKERDRDAGRPPPRREMGPPPRRDLGQPPRRDMGPPPRRDMPMKSNPRMRDDSPPPRMRPAKPSYRGRAVIDSDEEYDSEMDDFIDDSEVDMDNISAEISRIFNYDKRKYTYADESDDECMESSVHQQMMEERRSLRIGIQEDLEDIRREEEEKKRMKLKMKKKR